MLVSSWQEPEQIVPGRDLSRLILLSADKIVNIAPPKEG